MLYLSLGSNLGDRRRNLSTAIRLISERIGRISMISDIIETEPWGFSSSNMFLNQAVAVEAHDTPENILEQTQAIEREMGRLEKSHNGIYKDRAIDIDLLLYDDMIVNTERLTLPHPKMAQRRFVLEPLAMIAPYAVHPILKKNIKELLDSLV